MSTVISHIREAIAPELDCLNQRILRQLQSDNPLMETVISTYLQAKGKQIRPIIVILVARLLGTVQERVMAAAASVELLHNASLIHDDVVDNSTLRRGLPTINAIWDNHISVLVGDFFVSSAMQQAISTGDIRIIDALCELGKVLSLGELDQIYNARFHTLTEEAYYRIIDHKTASLFVACAKMGAYAVGATDQQTAYVAEYCRLLGLAFQIRDDILDYSTADKIGKPAGNDLREGKITLPLLHALIDAQGEEADAMRQLVRSEQLTEAEIATLMAFARDNGGIKYARAAIDDLRSKGAALLTANFSASPALDDLISIFSAI